MKIHSNDLGISTSNEVSELASNKSSLSKIALDKDESAQMLVNPIVSAAFPLIALIVVLGKNKNEPDIGEFRKNIYSEIKNFEFKLEEMGYSQKIVIVSSYVLCTAIDEKVLSMPWSNNHEWATESLLSITHEETFGGERFYLIMEKLLEDFSHYKEVIELMYLLLSLGFKGKFHNNPSMLTQIIKNLSRKIIANTSGFKKSMIPELWKSDRVVKKKRKIRVILLILSLILFSSLGILFIYSLYLSMPLVKLLNTFS